MCYSVHFMQTTRHSTTVSAKATTPAAVATHVVEEMYISPRYSVYNASVTHFLKAM